MDGGLGSAAEFRLGERVDRRLCQLGILGGRVNDPGLRPWIACLNLGREPKVLDDQGTRPCAHTAAFTPVVVLTAPAPHSDVVPGIRAIRISSEFGPIVIRLQRPVADR